MSESREPDRDHYTVTIEVTRTLVTKPDPHTNRSYSSTEPKAGTRKVEDVARMVVRADSIDALTSKATAHLELLKD